MFEFLFKYSPIVYKEGEWAFRGLPGAAWVIVLAMLVIAAFALIYLRTIAPASPVFRGLLAALKIAAVALLLLCLAEPFLSVTTVIPKKSSVLVLIDDSASMGINEGNARNARIGQVKDWIGTAERPGVRQKLENNFNVLFYRFNQDVQSLQDNDSLRAEGESTNLARALQFAEQQSHVHPISAVLLVTDGAHTAKRESNAIGSDEPLQAAAMLQNANIPVYAVGVGAAITNDIQLTRVSASRSVTENDVMEMTALIQAKGKQQSKVMVELLEEGRVVHKEEVPLSGRYNRVQLSHRPTTKGFLRYTARVVPADGEVITVNNEKSFLVNNEERIGRILYVEELHPWDFKFIKRALDLDKSLHFVSLVRTGPDKYLRQGILNQRTDLVDGFPTTRAELFSYHAVIISSIEAGWLTPEQQQLLHDFVSVRGGGLLMVGGPKSFSQGGWQNSKIAEILPVELLDAVEAAKEFNTPLRRKPFRLALTPDGLRSPMLQFSFDARENQELWNDLPELAGYNPVGAARPGATVLAVHPTNQAGRERILIAEQRYGSGRSMVLATSASWHWQMRSHSTDTRHERFWRQVGRWLALSAPEPVTVKVDRENYTPGEMVALQIDVLDSSFQAVSNAQVSVHLTPSYSSGAQNNGGSQGDPPVGNRISVDVLPVLGKAGRFQANFMPEREGLYEIEVLAHDPAGKYLGRSATGFFVNRDYAEYAQPDLQEPLLRRIAEVSGGKYLHLTDAGNIDQELAVARSSFARTVERDIWDSPGIYLAVLLLLGIEWFSRRAKGLS